MIIRYPVNDFLKIMYFFCFFTLFVCLLFETYISHLRNQNLIRSRTGRLNSKQFNLNSASFAFIDFLFTTGTSFHFFQGGQNFDRLPRGGKIWKIQHFVSKTQKSHYFLKSGGGEWPPPNEVPGSQTLQ